VNLADARDQDESLGRYVEHVRLFDAAREEKRDLVAGPQGIRVIHRAGQRLELRGGLPKDVETKQPEAGGLLDGGSRRLAEDAVGKTGQLGLQGVQAEQRHRADGLGVGLRGSGCGAGAGCVIGVQQVGRIAGVPKPSLDVGQRQARLLQAFAHASLEVWIGLEELHCLIH